MRAPYVSSPDIASNDVEIAAGSTDSLVDHKDGKTEKARGAGRTARAQRRPMTADDKKKFKLGGCVCMVIVLLTVIGVLVSSLKKISEKQWGVKYNIHSKQLADAAESGGLFVGPPGFKFIKFPSIYSTKNFDDRVCVSRDGLRVTISTTFQYQMTEENMIPAIEKYRDYDKWATVVEAAGLSAMHHSCSEFNTSDFQNKRGQIQANMEENLKLKLEGDPEQGIEGVYAIAVSLQLRNIGLPEDYRQAVREKQSAEEDIGLAKNERLQNTTQADTELLRAKEEARKILDTATNEADVLLTEARLKAEESTFAFEQEAKTIVEVRNSLNLTTEGVLAYLANTLMQEADTLKITTGEPAKLTRKEEL